MINGFSFSNLPLDGLLLGNPAMPKGDALGALPVPTFELPVSEAGDIAIAVEGSEQSEAELISADYRPKLAGAGLSRKSSHIEHLGNAEEISGDATDILALSVATDQMVIQPMTAKTELTPVGNAGSAMSPVALFSQHAVSETVSTSRPLAVAAEGTSIESAPLEMPQADQAIESRALTDGTRNTTATASRIAPENLGALATGPVQLTRTNLSAGRPLPGSVVALDGMTGVSENAISPASTENGAFSTTQQILPDTPPVASKIKDQANALADQASSAELAPPIETNSDDTNLARSSAPHHPAEPIASSVAAAAPTLMAAANPLPQAQNPLSGVPQSLPDMQFDEGFAARFGTAVTAAMMQMGNEGGMLSLRLTPDHLGPIAIRIAPDGNENSVHIETNDENVRQVLAQAQGRIEQEMRQASSRATSIQIEVRSEAGNMQDRPGSQSANTTTDQNPGHGSRQGSEPASRSSSSTSQLTDIERSSNRLTEDRNGRVFYA